MDKNQVTAYGTGYYEHKSAGYLCLTGADRASFLQRQTTNDTRLLKKGKALFSMLLSPTARILDVIYLQAGEEQIDLLTLPGHANDTYQYLKSHIFYMDQVQLSNISEKIAQIDLLGSQVTETLTDLGFPARISELEVISRWEDDVEIRLMRLPAVFQMGYKLLFPSQWVSVIRSKLNSLGLNEFDEETYHILRIENGLPGVPGELNQSYTPLEVGLESAISFDKGCYTGQEIIARKVTFDKVVQHLVSIKGNLPITVGEQLLIDGKPVGEVTSVCNSPRFGYIGLAMIRKPHDCPGTTLSCSEGASVIVHTLPLF